jgi:hypothetical protein
MGKMHCIICFPLKNESFMDAKEMHAGGHATAYMLSAPASASKKESKDARYPPSAPHAAPEGRRGAGYRAPMLAQKASNRNGQNIGWSNRIGNRYSSKSNAH